MSNHILLEAAGCQIGTSRVSDFKEVMREAILESGAHIVNELFHQFEPYGVSGIFILAESHVSIHTWPEDNSRASFDIFTCGESDLCEKIYQSILSHFSPKKYKFIKITRPELFIEDFKL